MYKPQPVDLSGVELPKELLELSELIAENTHDVWAERRISEGWSFGESRNDALKTTPCLVPYQALPESEKDYDRNTAFSTLKLIMKLGYTIEKNGSQS